MKRTPEDAWTRWLAAERDGDPETADAALRTVMTAVPRREPSTALSARLADVARLRAEPAVTSRRSEGLIALGLAAAALLMTLLPVGLIGVLFLTDAARVVSWLARSSLRVVEWFEAGASVWSVMAQTGAALGSAASSPEGSAGLTASLVVASMALLLLNRYLPPERS
jgi:hypothetical protein